MLLLLCVVFYVCLLFCSCCFCFRSEFSFGSFVSFFREVIMRRSAADVVLAYEAGEEDVYGCPLVCDPAEDMTRQEFKAECDTETILRRYGAFPSPPVGAYGAEIDFDLDLQGALQAQRVARIEYMRAPADLRLKYRSYGEFVRAIERGEIGIREVKEEEEPPIAPKPA